MEFRSPVQGDHFEKWKRVEAPITGEKFEKEDQEMQLHTPMLSEEIFDNQPIPPQDLAPKVLFPQRLKKNKLDKQFSKFLDVFKKLHINIPFAEALKQMPSYVKFMKDILSNKRRLEEYETTALTEECSAILQKKLGSREKLGLGEVRPTTVSLQLADRSIKHPRGSIEDVLVKVDKFILPADFFILDMEEDREIPIILGKPFLATGRALIDVQRGELRLRVQEEEVTFNVFDAINYPDTSESCFNIRAIDSLVTEVFNQQKESLEVFLVNPNPTMVEDLEVLEYAL
ncbi:uncharacterized protein LOC111373015 [Olea europaea var. sylvestris]|uniref:uncharacterized protein LOC111373015 n=1 Tax=Olea europaea var. sylvestris TaxID=158386 RepID=UPI000C1D6B21|nr:uncharacterized protein LOC111373015 [Olea europaea var. sylvestris]